MPQVDRMFSVFRTAASGMESQRVTIGASSENIANAGTTRTPGGGPYAIKRAVTEADAGRPSFSGLLSKARGELQVSNDRHIGMGSMRPGQREGEGRVIVGIEELPDTRMEYDPSHPHADENGYVHYPDINMVEEMTRMMSANRLYEANLTAVNAAKEMIKRTLEI